jgi:hypothetical protein
MSHREGCLGGCVHRLLAVALVTLLPFSPYLVYGPPMDAG